MEQLRWLLSLGSPGPSHAKLIARMPPSVLSAYKGEDHSQEDLAYALWTDVHVAAPARWIAKQTASGAPTYLYYFSYVPPDQRGKVRGAAHASELPFVFDNWEKAAPGRDIGDDVRAATKRVHACWVVLRAPESRPARALPTGLAIDRRTINSWNSEPPRRCDSTFEKHNSMRRKPQCTTISPLNGRSSISCSRMGSETIEDVPEAGSR